MGKATFPTTAAVKYPYKLGEEIVADTLGVMTGTGPDPRSILRTNPRTKEFEGLEEPRPYPAKRTGDIFLDALRYVPRPHHARETGEIFMDILRYVPRSGEAIKTAIRLGEEGGERAVQFRKVMAQGADGITDTTKHHLTPKEINHATRLSSVIRQGPFLSNYPQAAGAFSIINEPSLGDLGTILGTAVGTSPKMIAAPVHGASRVIGTVTRGANALNPEEVASALYQTGRYERELNKDNELQTRELIARELRKREPQYRAKGDLHKR